MKNRFFVFAISAFTITACNSSSDNNSVGNKMSDSSALTAQVSPFTSPVNGILHIYLEMKNAFVNDNDMDASKAAIEMIKALNGFEKEILRDAEKKPFEAIAVDIKTHAEYIRMNPGNIKKQREHFDMLSKGMNDMVKAFAAGETIYVNHCPMFNDRKGAIWLSETREIKNPYLGSAMLTCGKKTEIIQ